MSAIGTKRTYRAALHMSAIGGKADIQLAPINVRYCFANTPDLSDYPTLISPKRLRNPDFVIETGDGGAQPRSTFVWYPISNAPFDRDLELGVVDSHSVRVIPFPCRRILGGWIKAETKTRIDVSPTQARMVYRPERGARRETLRW